MDYDYWKTTPEVDELPIDDSDEKCDSADNKLKEIKENGSKNKEVCSRSCNSFQKI